MLSFKFMPDAVPSRVEQVLAALPLPMFVVQADRRLVYANRLAEQMLDDGRACSMAERLMAVGQLKANKIEEHLRQAACGQRSVAGLWFARGSSTGWLELARASSVLSDITSWPETSLLLAVHVDEPVLSQSARIDALCLQCRLTRTERYVLMLLADGLPVEAIARQLEVQVSTLRSHVRNLLTKTQAPSLMQLVRWLGCATSTPSPNS